MHGETDNFTQGQRDAFGWQAPIPEQTRPPLRRATARSAQMPTPWMAGVCSGLSIHLGVPIAIIRGTFAVLSIIFGVGFVLYLWLWCMVPADEGTSAGENEQKLNSGLVSIPADMGVKTARNQLLMSGAALLVVAGVAAAVASAQTLAFRDVFAIIVIVIGLGLVWSQGGNLDKARSFTFIVSVIAGAILLITGIVLIVGRDDPPIVLLRGGIIGAAVIAGVFFALVPLWLRTSKVLSDTQAQQVRDAERADIAAHLHDSVLQTLTLIRASADDATKVRAIALMEERELRSWLYTGQDEAQDSLAQAVRDVVGTVESRYGIAVDVVTVSDIRPGPGELTMVAALGEAVANAARHGAPPVSVYVEVRANSIEAFIKDSGEGFSLDNIPEDRHGVRDSIIGRMERIGGSARFRTLASGMEVALVLPVGER